MIKSILRHRAACVWLRADDQSTFNPQFRTGPPASPFVSIASMAVVHQVNQVTTTLVFTSIAQDMLWDWSSSGHGSRKSRE
jgi:hypothetical protein